MEIALAMLVVVAVGWFVTVPLRRTDAEAEEARGRVEDPEIAALEARKEAKYREIRDTELDREQGKLSLEDWRRQDAELRRDAVEILKQLDRVRGEGSPAA
jgi:hypothetical protein